MESTQTTGRARRKRIWLYVAGLALLVLLVTGYKLWIFFVDRYTEPPITIDSSRMSNLSAEFLTCSANKTQALPLWPRVPTPLEWKNLETEYGISPDFVLTAINLGYALWKAEWTQEYPPDMRTSLDLLDSAYKSGRYDYPLLLHMYCNREQWDPVEPLPVPNIVVQYSQDELGMAQQWRDCRPKAESAGGKQAKELLDELHKSAPQQALPYYFEAIESCRNSNNTEAQQFLRQGNAAPYCDFPAGPPLDEAWREACQGRAYGGDPALVELIVFGQMKWTYTDLGLDKAVVLLSQAAMTDRNPELLNDLNTALCRMYGSEPTGVLQGECGYDAFTAVAGAADKLCVHEVLTAPEANLAEYREKFAKLKPVDLEYVSLCGSPATMSDRLLYWIDHLVDQKTQYKSSIARCLSDMRARGQEQIAGCQTAANNNLPILRELQRFDFVSMSWRGGPENIATAGSNTADTQ